MYIYVAAKDEKFHAAHMAQAVEHAHSRGENWSAAWGTQHNTSRHLPLPKHVHVPYYKTPPAIVVFALLFLPQAVMRLDIR